MKPLIGTNHVTTLRKILSLALLLIAGQNGFAQARAQADVSITSVNISAAKPSRIIPASVPGSSRVQPGVKVTLPPEHLNCSITVHNENDDDANQTMLVVVVPVEVSIVSNPANASIYKAGGTSPFAGYLVFNLGNMYVGQNITVEFTFTKSVYGNKVGGYAYSASPDPNPANNYKDATY